MHDGDFMIESLCVKYGMRDGGLPSTEELAKYW